MIDNKAILILKQLYGKPKYTTANEISVSTNISIRTIKSIIKQINQEYPNSILSTHQGYLLKNQRVIQHYGLNTEIPNTIYERKIYILKTILIEQNHPSITELSEKLYISSTTLINELNKIRNEINQYHLNLHIKKDIVSISGTEKDKHDFVISIMNTELANNNFSIDNLQRIFTTVSLVDIQNLIISILNEEKLILDNYSLSNYILHLALTIETRNITQNHHPLYSSLSDFQQFIQKEYFSVVEKIYIKLKDKYPTCTYTEILEASVLMLTRITSKNSLSIKKKQFTDILGQETSDLLHQIIHQVKLIYHLDLNHESFIIRFGFHLKNLLIRSKFGFHISTINVENIKNDYPMLYTISVFISSIIQEEKNIRLNENEIAYISLHVGMLIEENNSVNKKLKCTLLTNQYSNVELALRQKITSIFYDTIILLPPNSTKTPDFYLITDAVQIHTDIPYCHIDSFLTNQNIRDIFSLIEKIQKEKELKILKEKILYFFKPELFAINDDFISSKSCIHNMCNQLVKYHYVNEEFEQSVLLREEISPSSFKNIAIPHPLNLSTISSAIHVCISKQPITWGINQVNLVLLLALNEDDRDLFTDIFQIIAKILNNHQNIQKIIDIQNFNDFIQFLLSDLS